MAAIAAKAERQINQSQQQHTRHLTALEAQPERTLTHKHHSHMQHVADIEQDAATQIQTGGQH